MVGLHYQVFPQQGISIVKSPKVEELSVLEELLTEKVLFPLAITVDSRLRAFVTIHIVMILKVTSKELAKVALIPHPSTNI